MNINLLTKVAIRSLRRHKMRSMLTTLGIIIGVIAIITVMSIGEGAKERVKQEIEKLGTNFIIALSKPVKQKMMLGKKMFKQSTLDAIVDECEGIDKFSAAIVENMVAIHNGESQRTQAIGVDPDYFTIRDWPIQNGNFFTDSDKRSSTKVVLIGQTVKKELFGAKDPIGKIIRIKNIPFKVIGVLGEKGTNPGGQDEDDTIFMPITTFQRKIAGVINKFVAMIFSAKNKAEVAKTALQIATNIKQKHTLKPQ